MLKKLPRDFPEEYIVAFCKASQPGAIKVAIQTLVESGSIRAGASPAENALINCANVAVK